MTTPRPLRSDARRNRAALLNAAAEVFATKGVTAATEEVARAAGVGIGTLFRHFPTKDCRGFVVLARYPRQHSCPGLTRALGDGRRARPLSLMPEGAGPCQPLWPECL
jgi:AcrR family transcriptional regulator